MVERISTVNLLFAGSDHGLSQPRPVSDSVRPAGARRGRAGHQLGFQYCHFLSSHDSTTLLFAFRYPGPDPIIACHGGAPGPLAESLSGPPGAEDLRINMREQNQDTK